MYTIQYISDNFKHFTEMIKIYNPLTKFFVTIFYVHQFQTFRRTVAHMLLMDIHSQTSGLLTSIDKQNK